jgi:hypothetical protein
MKGLALRNLKVNVTQTGYTSIKNGTRNVAIFIEHRGGWLLGIKHTYMSTQVRGLLAGCQALAGCPANQVGRFSPYGRGDWPHDSYAWYLVGQQSVLVGVLTALD